MYRLATRATAAAAEAAGVDEFVHVGVDALAALERAQEILEVSPATADGPRFGRSPTSALSTWLRWPPPIPGPGTLGCRGAQSGTACRRRAALGDARGHRRGPLYFGGRPSSGLDFLAHVPGSGAVPAGPYLTMYVNQPWTIRQYAGSPPPRTPTPSTGATWPPGRRGCRSPSTCPPTGGLTTIPACRRRRHGGVAIDSIYDMRVLFDGILLDQMSVSMTMNGAEPSSPVLSLYIVAAEEQGVTPEKLAGTIQNDILKGVHGPQHLYLPADAVDADHLRHLQLHLGADAEVQPDSISGYHMQEAGAMADLSWPTRSPTASSTSRQASTRVRDVDAFAPRLSFFLGDRHELFMEIAKMRAARLLWAKLVKERLPRQRQVVVVAHAQRRPQAGR